MSLSLDEYKSKLHKSINEFWREHGKYPECIYLGHEEYYGWLKVGPPMEEPDRFQGVEIIHVALMKYYRVV